MREILNLKAMKYSKNKKHNTIYEKAHRIMQKGWETEELSEEQIIKIANRYPNLSVRVIIGGDIIVKSKKDSWMIRDEGRFFTLYHKSLIFNKGRIKERYHIQDVFYDIEYVFASIVSHDDFALGIRSRSNDDIRKLIEQAGELKS